MPKKKSKNDLLKADSDGGICMAKATIFNTPTQMGHLHDAMQCTNPLDPDNEKQALAVIKVYMYAKIAERFVPATLWKKAGIDKYPEFSDDERVLYCATPLNSSKPIIQQMIEKIDVPVVNGKAKLTTPQARCHFESVCKELSITAGKVNLMPDEPAEEEDLREALSTIASLKIQLRNANAKAAAFHKAMVLWQAYALAPDAGDDPTEWPEIDTNYDAAIKLPNLAYPNADEDRYGSNVITHANTYESPLKRRRITFVDSSVVDDADDTGDA